METSSSRMSTYGYVSDLEIWSTSSASHSTLDFEPWAPSLTWISPRYDVRPPPRATDFDRIDDEVWGAACTILAPASWCCPSPANAIDRVSPLACSPIR